MPTVWEYILNFMYPLYCEVCGRALAADNKRRLCSYCWEKVSLPNSPYCPRPDIKSRVYFNQVRAVGKYEGILKQCIHLVKYKKKTALTRALSELMVGHIKNHFDIDKIDYLIPVPLYRRQYRKRGFNQTELLIDGIGKYFNKKVINNNLKRIKNTKPQYKLNKDARIENLRDSFFVRKPGVFGKKSVLLIDDVYTTGTTVNECSKVLYKAGVRLINVLVLAHGS